MRLVSLVLCFVALVAITSNAYGLEIQVAPKSLSMSSGGHNVTVHTNYKGRPPADSYSLWLTPKDGTEEEVKIVFTKLDLCGYFVVRCTRIDAATAVGDFKGKCTTATVTLKIKEDSGAQTIIVRK